MTKDTLIEIEIDGKTLPAKPGAMIIQVADEAGIYIPRFCYHKKLSIAANCRMCLVEVEKAPKTLPACATPVAPGMKVFTQSEKTLESQKSVMEFLLINHPLDCPICDQGGECELQDLSLGFGRGVSRLNVGKRSVKDKNLGPLVSSEMTRCIHCTRCVRFGDEVAGMRELGGTGRGDETEIGTYVQHAMQSELSGNVIDVCPVGALTSKPYRFSARAWEMTQHEAIAPHDCLGSNIYLHTRGEEYSAARHVMRVVPRENEAINETWLSDRDRYSYEAIHSENRLLKPLIKRNSVWQEASWSEALDAVLERLQSIAPKIGPAQIGAIMSPSASLEEAYLLQKLLRAIGSPHIDHRIRQTDFSGAEDLPLYPQLGMPIAELENVDAVVLIGSDIRREQPLANARLRKAIKKGAAAFCINPIDYELNFSVAGKWIVAEQEMVIELAKILQAVCQKTQQIIPEAIQRILKTVKPGAAEIAMAEKLLAAQNGVVLLGAYGINQTHATIIRGLAAHLASLTQAKLGFLTEGANSAGACLAGVLPHRGPAGENIAAPGLNAKTMFTEKLAAYILYAVEPELDCAFADAAVQALKTANTVVAFSAFRSAALEQYADILLPITTFAEMSGTYVNVEGHWQSMHAAMPPLGEARPGWEVLQVLGNLWGLPGFVYPASFAVREELKMQIDSIEQPNFGPDAFMENDDWMADLVDMLAEKPEQNLHRLAEWPMYRVDGLVRRASALQASIREDMLAIRIHSALAQRLHLTDGELAVAEQGNSRLELPIIIDDAIPDCAVYIAAGLEGTAGFGESFGAIRLAKKS